MLKKLEPTLERVSIRNAKLRARLDKLRKRGLPEEHISDMEEISQNADNALDLVRVAPLPRMPAGAQGLMYLDAILRMIDGITEAIMLIDEAIFFLEEAASEMEHSEESTWQAIKRKVKSAFQDKKSEVELKISGMETAIAEQWEVLSTIWAEAEIEPMLAASSPMALFEAAEAAGEAAEQIENSADSLTISEEEMQDSVTEDAQDASSVLELIHHNAQSALDILKATTKIIRIVRNTLGWAIRVISVPKVPFLPLPRTGWDILSIYQWIAAIDGAVPDIIPDKVDRIISRIPPTLIVQGLNLAPKVTQFILNPKAQIPKIGFDAGGTIF